MNERILVVDDEAAVRELLVSQITHMGHVCTGVASADVALEAAAKHPRPALVLSDIQMPGRSGMDLLKGLVELDETIQVVMVTADGELDTVRKCLRLGAYDYLLKPYALTELGQTIDRALERRRLKLQVAAYQRDLEHKVEEKTREVLETRDIAMLAVAKLAECRDDTTGFHLDRIQWFSRLVGEALAEGPYADRVSPEFVDHLFKSSPLHDIGKVAIPDRILMKPGPLDPDEWRVMQSHTTQGGDTLREVIEAHRSPSGQGARFLRMAMVIAYDHHERWDGTGYPEGKAGEEIPLEARIVALADAYDAITSERPYKAALSHPEAIRRILRDRGRHFDPLVTDAFVRCAPKFELIRRQMQGRENDQRHVAEALP